MEYSFHFYNTMAETGLMMALERILGAQKGLSAPPVVLCIGSDLAVGDSLGPLTGTILKENGFTGYVRPDHGRMIWGETGRPGYGLYDRALGAAYINGLFEAAEKELAAKKGPDTFKKD